MPPENDVLPLPPVPGTDSRPTIYVINNDSAFLEMIGDLLTDMRAHVLLEQMRPNVEVTLDNLRSAQPDLLILDVVPHRSSALELLQRLQLDPVLSHLPVMVASTSIGLAESLAIAYPDLIRDTLPKPFTLDEFYVRMKLLVAGVRAP